MLTISELLVAPNTGAFYYDDQLAIRRGVRLNGFTLSGKPLTPGFARVRIPAESVSVGLVLSDGTVVWGDCASVQYAGSSGRDPVLTPGQMCGLLDRRIGPKVAGLAAMSLIPNCQKLFDENDGSTLPKSIKYGLSQALLRAASHARKITMAEVITEDMGLAPPVQEVPIFAQSGDERYDNVDKMIMKSIDILPHGLINTSEKFGYRGAKFQEYVIWVAERVRALGGGGYRPALHFDTYGWVGLGISLNVVEIAEFIADIADSVPDFDLAIECPADFGSQEAQINGYADIVRELEALGSSAKIVADEYCNTLSDIRLFSDNKAGHIIQVKTPDLGSILDTVEAIKLVKDAGLGAYSGGTSAETDQSAQVCVHVAVAARADMMLAKPGMGVDESITIVRNEQRRLLATTRHKFEKEVRA